MTEIRAHELAARARAAGLTINEMCARAGVQRVTFDAWLTASTPTPTAVVRSMVEVVRNAESGGQRSNVPVAKAARLAEIQRCKAILGWGMPVLADKLGIPLPSALKINVGKVDVSDADIDYMQRLAAAVEAVPRQRPAAVDDGATAAAPGAEGDGTTEDDDMALRQQVIDEAVAVYLETPAEGDEGAGARWAIGQVLARLGLLGEARARLQAAKPWAEAAAAEATETTDDGGGAIGRVPFPPAEAATV